jgi:hypothetical protein
VERGLFKGIKEEHWAQREIEVYCKATFNSRNHEQTNSRSIISCKVGR